MHITLYSSQQSVLGTCFPKRIQMLKFAYMQTEWELFTFEMVAELWVRKWQMFNRDLYNIFEAVSVKQIVC